MGLGANAIGIRLVRPSRLSIDPMTVACPLCGARAPRDCKLSAGRFDIVHVERIRAAMVKSIEARSSERIDTGFGRKEKSSHPDLKGCPAGADRSSMLARAWERLEAFVRKEQNPSPI